MPSEFKEIKTTPYSEAQYCSFAVLPNLHSKRLYFRAFLAHIFVVLIRFISSNKAWGTCNKACWSVRRICFGDIFQNTVRNCMLLLTQVRTCTGYQCICRVLCLRGGRAAGGAESCSQSLTARPPEVQPGGLSPDSRHSNTQPSPLRSTGRTCL